VLQAERGKKVRIATDLRADAPAPAAHALAPTAAEEAEGEKKPEVKDPVATARKAGAYRAEQAKLGNSITAAEAVAHVTAGEAK
jgi:hypothetical protein